MFFNELLSMARGVQKQVILNLFFVPAQQQRARKKKLNFSSNRDETSGEEKL